MPRKHTLVLLLIITILFILMTYQSRRGLLISGQPAAGLLQESSELFHDITHLFINPFRKITIREQELGELRERNKKLLVEQSRYQEAIRENQRLRDLLGLLEQTQGAVTTARIIARGTDHWKNTVILDRGASNGIGKNMAVITPKGLAGKIIITTDSNATALLITDINFSAAIRIQTSRREGIVSGTGRSKLLLKYIPYEEEVLPGDILITSGLDRLFPPGIPVGYVTSISRQGSSYFQEIEVTPYIDSFRIEEVLVVK